MASREEKINIYLKVIKTVSFEVKRSETIRNLKAIICEKEGISEYTQELFFTGERLKDDDKLVDCGIKENSTLNLILQNSMVMKLFVNIPSRQQTIEVEAKNHDTIQNIKFRIQSKEGIHSDRCTLFFAGRLLENDQTLAFLQIKGESTLHLVFNPRDVMSVSVKMPTGEIVKTVVKVLYTVRDVKAILGSMAGFPLDNQDLIYAGKQLDDSKTLAGYNIKEESILEFVSRSMQIFVKKWSGETMTLYVRKQDAVRDVKNKIFQKLGITGDFYGIVFAGKSLEDDRDLASYGIENHSTLRMVFRMVTQFHPMKLSEIGGCEPGLPRSTTIHCLKKMIEKKMKKRVKEVLLHGLALQDQLSLADYGINQSTRMCIAFEQ